MSMTLRYPPRQARQLNGGPSPKASRDFFRILAVIPYGRLMGKINDENSIFNTLTISKLKCHFSAAQEWAVPVPLSSLRSSFRLIRFGEYSYRSLCRTSPSSAERLMLKRPSSGVTGGGAQGMSWCSFGRVNRGNCFCEFYNQI